MKVRGMLKVFGLQPKAVQSEMQEIALSNGAQTTRLCVFNVPGETGWYLNACVELQGGKRVFEVSMLKLTTWDVSAKPYRGHEAGFLMLSDVIAIDVGAENVPIAELFFDQFAEVSRV